MLAVITGTYRDTAPDSVSSISESVSSSTAVEHEAEPTDWASNVLRHWGWAFLVQSTILLQSGCILALTQYVEKSNFGMLVIILISNSVFLLELFFRLMASSSLVKFLGKSFHYLEMALTVSSVAGIGLRQPALIVFPILRLYRLTGYLPTINSLLQTLISTKNTLLQLVVFVWFSSLIFSVLARYYFRAALEEFTRSHFSNIGQALLTTFQLFTGDQWR